MDEKTRERTLKMMATDEEWDTFMSSIPRNWRERFFALADEPQPEEEVSSHVRHRVRDNRKLDQDSMFYQGSFIRSWQWGADRVGMVEFNGGLTWGSVGGLLGYLFGEKSAHEIHEVFKALVLEMMDRQIGGE